MNKKTLIINLFGGPGTGKSTLAAYIFAMLKMRGVDSELITEFAKDKVWENNEEVFTNQAYLFGEQSFKISRCDGKVDVIVTDSPLPLSIIYNNDKRLTENFNLTVMDVFNSYNNLNFFLIRQKEYNPNGRRQTKEEAIEVDDMIKKMLKERNISYETAMGNQSGADEIVETIIKYLYND